MEKEKFQYRNTERLNSYAKVPKEKNKGNSGMTI